MLSSSSVRSVCARVWSLPLRRTLHEVSSAQFLRTKQQYDVVLDVREPSEMSEGYVPDSVLTPLSKLPQLIADGALNEHKDDNVMVYCRAGRRSLTAGAMLEAAGFKRVTHMVDGYNGYKVSSTSTSSDGAEAAAKK